MKNYPVIALAALAGMFVASCDSYDLPNPPAQSNAAEEIFDATTLVVTPVSNGTIDLKALDAAQSRVDLFSVAVENVPAAYTLNYEAEFSATADFVELADVKLSAGADGNIGLSVGELQAVFNQLVSKAPEANNINVRVAVSAQNGTSVVCIGGPDKYYYSAVLNVTPLPQEYVIEDTYYLVGNFCNWDLTQAIAFSQTTEGSPYDYPNFMVKIDVTADQAAGDGYQWKVVPASAVAAATMTGAYGAVASEESTLAGTLVAVDGQEQPGVITQEGPYIIKVNMETLEYGIDQAFDYLWVPGYGSSVSDFNKMMRLVNKGDYIHYEGTLRLSNRFWLTGQASLKGVNYRPDGPDNPVGEDGVLSGKMIYDPTSTNTMKVPTAGLYYLEANIIDLTWKATPIPMLNLIGNFNEWDLATAPEMTPNNNKNVWTITQTFSAPGEFKACVNKSWTYSYGTADGTFQNVTQNGGNYKIEEAGTYDITFHFDVFPNYLEVVKK